MIGHFLAKRNLYFLPLPPLFKQRFRATVHQRGSKLIQDQRVLDQANY